MTGSACHRIYSKTARPLPSILIHIISTRSNIIIIHHPFFAYMGGLRWLTGPPDRRSPIGTAGKACIDSSPYRGSGGAEGHCGHA